ncbi:TRAP transporter small permease [Pseudooceanicola nanhaiensis]|uniref:TRAP transporter small permease n=1 Tax=Pseudooceanicola nanhaiensis TaxID=375761 RepID=UPI003517393C
MLHSLYRALGKFEWGLASIGAGLCLFAIMMITVISVFGRYVMMTDLIPGSFNIIERMLFPLMVFWALPLAHRDGIFPKLELLPAMLPNRLGNSLAILALVVELAIFAYLTWRLGLFALSGFETGRTMQLGSGYFPVWPFMMMVPFAFGLMVIEMLWQIGLHLRHFSTRAANEIGRHEMV